MLTPVNITPLWFKDAMSSEHVLQKVKSYQKYPILQRKSSTPPNFSETVNGRWRSFAAKGFSWQQVSEKQHVQHLSVQIKRIQSYQMYYIHFILKKEMLIYVKASIMVKTKPQSAANTSEKDFKKR